MESAHPLSMAELRLLLQFIGLPRSSGSESLKMELDASTGALFDDEYGSLSPSVHSSA